MRSVHETFDKDFDYYCIFIRPKQPKPFKSIADFNKLSDEDAEAEKNYMRDFVKPQMNNLIFQNISQNDYEKYQ